MSKIAAQNDVGSNLRKLIDYFCHLIKTPDFYSDLENIDKDFAKTGFLQKIQWLEKEIIIYTNLDIRIYFVLHLQVNLTEGKCQI